MSFPPRLLLVAALAFLPGPATAGEPAAPRDQEIARLVKELGSEEFEKRQAANKGLEEIGEPALPALEKAANSNDAEVRRRAALLAATLRSRKENREARQVIARGIEAQGGEANLARCRALKYKGNGVLDIEGDPVPCTVEAVQRFPSRSRTTVRYVRGERPTTDVALVDLDKPEPLLGSSTIVLHRTVRIREKPVDLRGRASVREKNIIVKVHTRQPRHAETIPLLPPLMADKGLTLSILDGARVGGKAVAGVRVERAARRDVKLFFDKETGLLLKYEIPAKDDGVSVEVFFSDYEVFDGVQLPRKIDTRVAGKDYLKVEVANYEVLQTVDDSEFAEP